MKFKNLFVALIVYVNDLLITGTDASKILQHEEFLDQQFTIINFGQADFFLGVELVHSQDEILIS